MFNEIKECVKDLKLLIADIKKEIIEIKASVKKLEGRIDVVSMIQKKTRKK